MAAETVVSVRGEAHRTIEPDSVDLHCAIHVVGKSKPAALDLLATAQRSLGDRLASLGGLMLTAATAHELLTWSTHAISTHPEHDVDETGRHAPTGRIEADAGVLVSVRELAKLVSVETALAGVPELSTDHVSWRVDAANPAWKEVRAEAITAAIQKGRDYANALGGSIVRVDQIADTGLLTDAHAVRTRAPQAFAATAGGMGPGVPGLDPVPQEIGAVIEARLVAEVPPLAER